LKNLHEEDDNMRVRSFSARLVFVLFVTLVCPDSLFSASAPLKATFTYGGLNELRMRPLVAHCHVGLGKLYRRTGDYEKAKTQLANDVAMMREMSMGLWLEKAKAELKELG
jgi:hypothetical protein